MPFKMISIEKIKEKITTKLFLQLICTNLQNKKSCQVRLLISQSNKIYSIGRRIYTSKS